MPFGGLLTAAVVSYGVKKYGEHKQASKQNEAALDQAEQNNEYREAVMEAKRKELDALTASGWNPAGVNQLTFGRNDTSNTNTRGHEDTYSKENPFVTAEYKKLDDLSRGVLENRLSRGSSLPPGYEQQGIKKINAAYAGADASAKNAAARKGFSGAQAFGLSSAANAGRANSIGQFRVDKELEERKAMDSDLAMEADRQSRFGTGKETRGTRDWRTSSQTDSASQGYNDVAPNIGDLSSLLAPPGSEQSTVSPYSGWGALAQGVGGAGEIVTNAYMQQRAKNGQSTFNTPGQSNTNSNPFATAPLTCPGGRGTYPNCY